MSKIAEFENEYSDLCNWFIDETIAKNINKSTILEIVLERFVERRLDYQFKKYWWRLWI